MNCHHLFRKEAEIIVHKKVCKDHNFYHMTLTYNVTRGGSRTAAASKMECFAIIVNDFQPLTIITKHSILDVAAALDPPLVTKILSNITIVKPMKVPYIIYADTERLQDTC